MAESSKKPKKSKEERAKEFLSNSAFARNAFLLFNKATDIVSAQEQGDLQSAKQILEQMLHSILFLGHIHVPVYRPEHIFSDMEMLQRTMNVSPKPFECFQTHVALRTPFSYFLQLLTVCYSENQEATVKNKLAALLADCKKSGDRYPLISIVICICEYNNRRYYGASLSCESDKERKIMTSVSCLKVWHRKVSSAVMSMFPQDTGTQCTIQLPATVRCEAFALEDMSQVKPPCGRCHQLYSLPGHTDILNEPGNCAETEAISNLLQGQDVSTITGGVYSDQEIKERMTACFTQTMKKNNADKYNIQVVYN
ncbi:uncharacterized protein LOC113640149 isoform X1 [Tachysurus fulvidraco]|uniref:uncharacterized protein LOC113640149 isoform X1 n=2 Tax=Tachysurus fulvidraco TaxID=1234273 RepID=UPI000F4DDAB9|nr:uncharacterized protein LOC113640149 isoform X1 [Tachysurus fulvidraco]